MALTAMTHSSTRSVWSSLTSLPTRIRWALQDFINDLVSAQDRATDASAVYPSVLDLRRQESLIALLEEQATALSRLAALPENWDRTGAPPVEMSAIRMALAFIFAAHRSSPLLVKPFVTPLTSGGVQVGWHTDRGEVELELSPGAQVTVYFDCYSDDSLSWESDATLQGDIVLRALSELTALSH